MTTRVIVNEGSVMALRVDFLDENGAPAIPSSVTYRVDDITDMPDYAAGTQVRADTPITPAESVEITLGPDDTAILNQSSWFEKRRVTVKASYGSSNTLNDQFFFHVRNLGGV